jgi:hypothetical protein
MPATFTDIKTSVQVLLSIYLGCQIFNLIMGFLVMLHKI